MTRRPVRPIQLVRVPWLWLKTRRIRNRWRAMEAEDAFDATRGTETSRHLLRLNYGATPVRTFRRVLAAIDVPLADFAFVDLGSGKGRAVLLAAEEPFRKVVGVEASRRLHAVAERNLARSEVPEGRVELRLQDAVDFVRAAWPSGPVLLFLYCPFPSSVLRQVRDGILRQAGSATQELIVAFVNPNESMLAVLREWPRLRRVARYEPSDPALRVYEAFDVFTTSEPAT